MELIDSTGAQALAEFRFVWATDYNVGIRRYTLSVIDFVNDRKESKKMGTVTSIIAYPKLDWSPTVTSIVTYIGAQALPVVIGAQASPAIMSVIDFVNDRKESKKMVTCGLVSFLILG